MLNMFKNSKEKCLSHDEMNEKIKQMMEERQRIDSEARARYGNQSNTTLAGFDEKPMSHEELNEKIKQMMEERQRIDSEARARYGGPSVKNL
jgi:uncharacterized protein YdcH (DUF465 family)